MATLVYAALYSKRNRLFTTVNTLHFSKALFERLSNANSKGKFAKHRETGHRFFIVPTVVVFSVKSN